MPLDDFGDPSSQLSEPPADPIWQFLAGAADDFMFVEPMPSLPNCRITSIRAAFYVDDPQGLDSPTNTWDSVIVTVYPDIGLDGPDGEPDDMGGVIGSYIKSQEVPASALQNETLVGACRPCHVVDIPVDILVQKNTRYWLSIVPRHPAPPQSFWCLSDTNTDANAVYGFPLDPMSPFWTAFGGNLASCPDTPAPGTRRNLSFVLNAVSEADVTGACCDDDAPPCTDSVSVVNCQTQSQRFAAGTACMDLNPPCGTTDPRACCFGDGTCMEPLTPVDCFHLGGQWIDSVCMSAPCVPGNDNCSDAFIIGGSDILVPFNTANATLDSLPTTQTTACGDPDKDIWYLYKTTCDGTLTIDTVGSSFDTLITVYAMVDFSCPLPFPCPGTAIPPMGPVEIDCNDDAPGDVVSSLSFTVSQVQCILIRVGGKIGVMPSGGPGMMHVQCVPFGPGACCMANAGCVDMQTPDECNMLGGTYLPGGCMSVSCLGACCHADGTCEDLSQDACVTPGDTFQGHNTICGVAMCPPPGGMCTVAAPQEVIGSDSVSDDRFGNSVAISGDRAVIGAWRNAGMGAAYVFQQSAGTWTEDAKLTAPDGGPSIKFGTAVAISGDTALVGALSGTGISPNTGAAYVYIDSGGGWMFQQKLFDPAGVNTQEFGRSVALDGDTALIGAHFDPTIASTAGAGFVFVRSAGVWGTPPQKLLASDGGAGDQLGWSVDVDADTAILGAVGDDDGGNGAGAAYIFTRSAGVWTEQQKLVALDPAMNDALGWSVGIAGDTAVVGTPFASGTGAVYVFVRSAGVWSQQQKLIADDAASGDQFGFTVAIEGDTVVIGAPSDDDGAPQSGSVYVFVRTGGIWTQRQKAVANDPGDGSSVGISVSFSTNTIVAGALLGEINMPDSGSAYFFDLSCEGACCLGDGNCLFLNPADCEMMGGTHLGNGTLCSAESCAFLGRGCAGDLNNDCAVTTLDIPAFVDALLGTAMLTAPALCRADVNADSAINGLDIQPFIDRLLVMATCNCCRGDTNRDGKLDGLDLQGLVNAILMPPDPCSRDFANADVNGDDLVDIADIDVMVAKLINGETCAVAP